ncbi:uncharacterized protein LY89DRAFT_653469 [Mollisia scopiformis]|uniref:COP9 signalosome complex subunit 3 n=1 Tax=Mollisia scopiformis TaxID=149040 RepID=A0A194WVD8_MOLSC|nr:uncharacterized protein LY89DRAFT_653469 [Mollisia scopiformis]KUJ11933.1 hypothetical protein LY89DRAFT_653469 [Mollisia scopiformis]
MDDLLSKLLMFPPHPPPAKPLSDHAYDEGIKEQIEVVGKMSETKLLQQTSGGEHALDVINPSLNTIPYACILLANISALKKGNNKGVEIDTLWEKMIGFLSAFDSRQIRYIGDELSAIIEAVAATAFSTRQAHLAVGPIASALMRLDPTGTMLTTHHLDLARLALDSRNFADAAPVLNKSILYVPGASTITKPRYICDMTLSPVSFITLQSKLTKKLKYLEILEYFLYSGMVFIGMRDWESALQCLENAVTYPAKETSVSKVMVEAYKKWILVGVLLEGRLLPLPKSTSSGAAKCYHVMAKPYETMAQIFENGTASRLKAEADTATNIWRADFNTGLILHLLAAFQKFQIRSLAKVYTKITIPEIVSQTTSAETGTKLPNPQAAELLIQNMIATGELHATMSPPTGGPSILTFSPTGQALTEPQMQRELVLTSERIVSLTKEIKQTDRILTHDKGYIKYVQKQSKNAKTSGATGDQGISGPDMDWNDALEDEDIMGPMY